MSPFWQEMPYPKLAHSLLPLFHKTESFYLPKILEKGAIATKPCQFFKEDLVYAFYGKPAYRTKGSGKENRMLEYYPVAILLDPSGPYDIKRIFPFDTGAMKRGRYADFMHHDSTCEDFEIPLPIENVKSVIEFFFSSNKDYILSRPNKGVTPNPTNFEQSSIARMVNYTGGSSSDDRRITIEIQIGDNVIITKKSVLGIVAPSAFEDNDQFRKNVIDVDIPVKYYDCLISNPMETHSIIVEKSRELMIDLGLF